MHHLIEQLVKKYPDLDPCAVQIEQAYETLKQSYEGGGKLLIAGNGGSAADCEHIVGELMKGFMSRRTVPTDLRQKLKQAFPQEGEQLADELQGALPAISLVSHSALSTAYANDVAADMVFAQQVYGYGKQGDVLLVLSTSGNSLNTVCAVQIAHVQGVKTIGMTGEHGGTLNELCDVMIKVPYTSTPDIQERHLPIYHCLCMMLEEAFFA